jgi:hypothetical protein
MAWGDGSNIDAVRDVLGRQDLRDRFQDAAQTYFDRQGRGVTFDRDGRLAPAGRLPPAPPPLKTDYTPFIIAGMATIAAAFIVTRKKS